MVQVREDGWIMHDPCGGYGSGPHRDLDEVFLKLPGKVFFWGGGNPFESIPCTHTGERFAFCQVAELGREGASLSCMHLRLKNGVWRPCAAYGGDLVVANAYPP